MPKLLGEYPRWQWGIQALNCPGKVVWEPHNMKRVRKSSSRADQSFYPCRFAPNRSGDADLGSSILLLWAATRPDRAAPLSAHINQFLLCRFAPNRRRDAHLESSILLLPGAMRPGRSAECRYSKRKIRSNFRWAHPQSVQDFRLVFPDGAEVLTARTSSSGAGTTGRRFQGHRRHAPARLASVSAPIAAASARLALRSFPC